MVNEEIRAAARRRGYPVIPASNWQDLRRRFAATPPRGEVNAAYLAGVLNIGDRAAANILPSLRQLGLVDAQNRVTDRAMAWRDDEHYGEVARAMFEEVYPQALRDVAPPPNPDREIAKRWFMRDLQAGEAQGERLARFYLLLASGDPNPTDEAAERASSPTRVRPAPRPRNQPAQTRSAQPQAGSAAREASVADTPQVSAPPSPRTPSVHIDIQVHIDPAASADQIDAIFASMARHLYGRE